MVLSYFLSPVYSDTTTQLNSTQLGDSERRAWPSSSSLWVTHDVMCDAK